MAKNKGNNTGMIKGNNTVHPEGPSLGAVRYAPFQDRASYTRSKPKNFLGADRRPVSSMTMHPTTPDVSVNTRTAVNNGYMGQFKAGKGYAERKQTPGQNAGVTIK